MMVGPYVWSFIGTGYSSASSGDTICENCSVVMTGVSIMNSSASSQTFGNVDATPISVCHRVCEMIRDCSANVCCRVFPLTLFSGDSFGANVNVALCEQQNTRASHCTTGLRRQCGRCCSCLCMELKLLFRFIIHFCGAHLGFKNFCSFYGLQFLRQHSFNSHHRCDNPRICLL